LDTTVGIINTEVDRVPTLRDFDGSGPPEPFLFVAPVGSPWCLVPQVRAPGFWGARIPRLRSGFRQRAQTPAGRLNLGEGISLSAPPQAFCSRFRTVHSDSIFHDSGLPRCMVPVTAPLPLLRR